MPTTQSLMSVATNPNLRVFERIRIIKGDDKKISSPEEAKAILAIPSSDVVWSDNKSALPLAQLDATNYLKYGDSNIWDSIAQAGKYLKNKGSEAIARFSNYFGRYENYAQSKK